MKWIFALFHSCLWGVTFAQFSTADEIRILREEHLLELTDSSTHILNEEEIASFEGLDYFPFSPEYQITARFTKSPGKRFKMPTTTDRLPVYRRYGYIEFEVGGDTCTLEVYQNMALRRQPEYRDYLFIPFRDAISGKETYGGGRYLDVHIPNGGTLLLDFNRVYNPYCAYSHRYSCPVPPEVNTLIVSIRAGEKTPPGH